MRNFESFTKEEQKDALAAAKLYMNTYSMRVEALVKSIDRQVAPSGSDIFHPELWKGIHWRWYLGY